MLIYLLVALFATIVGAAAGLGGGVIIKPVLDMLGDYDIVTISVLSSATVLSMAAVATFRQMKNGFSITKTTVAITVGAVIGGMLGSVLFSMVKDSMNPSTVTIVQSGIIIALLLLCLFYCKLPKFHIKSIFTQSMIGLFLGMLSSFLGIGGGPINVAILVILMAMELRDAAKVSVFIILFAQTSGLIMKVINGTFAQVEDFSMLIVMIPAAIAGGIIGSQLNLKLSDKWINKVYTGAVLLVILICVYNIAKLV